jgi:NitT/TauT family transport system substrate-binding protein
MLTALAAASLPLGGCAPPTPLRLGTHPWVGHEPLLLARDFHWLPPEVNVSMGSVAPDSLDGLKQGRLDGATLTLDETLAARSAGVPLTVVLVLDSSAGADMVLARDGLPSLPSLRGQRLAVERSAVGELMLIKALAAAGLAESDLRLVEMPVDQQPLAWTEGRIDAAITYEPTASRLVRLGAHRLFDSRAIPEMIFDVLAIRTDRLWGRRTTLEATVAAHFKGLHHLRSNRPDATYRIASRQSLRLDEVTQALAGVSLPDLQRNRSLLSPGSPLASAAQVLAGLMAGRRPAASGAHAGLVDRLDDLFDPTYLPMNEVTA